MTTTIDLTNEEIAELKEFTKQEDVSSAVRFAIREYLQYVKRMRRTPLSDKTESEGA